MNPPDSVLFLGRFHPVLVHLPIGLIEKFAELTHSATNVRRAALVVDVLGLAGDKERGLAEMERAARGDMSDEEFAPNGIISEAGLARLRTLIEHAPEAIVVFDGDTGRLEILPLGECP